MVTSLRSLEKYILSYLNTTPIADEGKHQNIFNIYFSYDEMLGIGSLSNRDSWRAYNETDIDSMKVRNPYERAKVCSNKDYFRLI